MNAPMLLPFISLSAGILLTFPGSGLWIGTLMILLGSGIYFFISAFNGNPIKSFRYAPLHYLWIALWIAGIGMINESLSLPESPSLSEMDNAILAEGRISSIKNLTSGDRLTVEVFSTYDKSGVKKKWHNFNLLTHSDAVSAKVGDIVAFPLKGIKRISDSENTFKKGYAESMEKRGIYYSLHLPGNEIRKTGTEFSLTALSNELRDNFVAFIEKRPLKKETREFIITLLAGDKNYLDENTRSLFADAGIAHVLALSGMHIGIISGIILFLLFPLNFFGKYKIRFFLTALILWIYAFITGMSPSIVRACVMASAFIIAIILERKNTALNSLSLAGFIILLFSPNSIFDVGFQLSFVCVASLILFADKLNPINRRFHPKLYNLFALLIASLIATFSSWIIVAYYFHNFPTMFLPANLLIIPFIPAYVVIILLSFALSIMGMNSYLLYQFIDKCYEVMKSIIMFFSQGSSLHIDVPMEAVFLWLAGLTILGIAINKKYLKLGLTISCTLFLGSFITAIIFPPSTMENGLLICNTYPQVELKISDSIEEKNIDVPLNAISIHNIKGINVCVLDYKQIPLNMSTLNHKIDYLIITGRYVGSLNEVLEFFHPDKVITHSSMRKSREKALRKEAEKKAIQIHSLRDEKALKILF